MTTSAKKKKLDLDSTENQRIRGQFVEREVKACFSYEMEAILRASANVTWNGKKGDYPLPNYDEIENLYEYECPKCGWGETDLQQFKCVEDGFKCPSCEKAFDEEPESEAQEIFEWWIVTEYFYKQLKVKGHPVLEWGNNYYWGRCTTGQSISMDGVIGSICAEMEILAGQKFSWEASK